MQETRDALNDHLDGVNRETSKKVLKYQAAKKHGSPMFNSEDEDASEDEEPSNKKTKLEQRHVFKFICKPESNAFRFEIKLTKVKSMTTAFTQEHVHDCSNLGTSYYKHQNKLIYI